MLALKSRDQATSDVTCSSFMASVMAEFVDGALRMSVLIDYRKIMTSICHNYHFHVVIDFMCFCFYSSFANILYSVVLTRNFMQSSRLSCDKEIGACFLGHASR